jgi:hypothetical protein
LPTVLSTARLGPVTLPAPSVAPRQLAGDHGHLWQWLGDGHELVSLSVAVRTTRFRTPSGARRRLAWEAQRVRDDLDPEADSTLVDPVAVEVDGAVGAAVAEVDGSQRSLAVHHRLVMTTDGTHLHLVQVVTRDTSEGRELADVVTAGLEVTPWSLPA